MTTTKFGDTITVVITGYDSFITIRTLDHDGATIGSVDVVGGTFGNDVQIVLTPDPYTEAGSHVASVTLTDEGWAVRPREAAITGLGGHATHYPAGEANPAWHAPVAPYSESLEIVFPAHVIATAWMQARSVLKRAELVRS